MNQNINIDPHQEKSTKASDETGKILGGLVVVLVGAVLLMKQLNVELPEWIYTWPMIIIAIGFYSGAKNSFRDWGWLITVSVGLVFLADRFVPGFSAYHAWPIVIIIIGVGMILQPKKNGKRCM